MVRRQIRLILCIENASVNHRPLPELLITMNIVIVSYRKLHNILQIVNWRVQRAIVLRWRIYYFRLSHWKMAYSAYFSDIKRAASQQIENELRKLCDCLTTNQHWSLWLRRTFCIALIVLDVYLSRLSLSLSLSHTHTHPLHHISIKSAATASKMHINWSVRPQHLDELELFLHPKTLSVSCSNV